MDQPGFDAASGHSERPEAGKTSAAREEAATAQELARGAGELMVAKLGSPWPNLLQQSENQYKDAYKAYQSGIYDQAATSIRAASHLAHAIDHALHISPDPNQPVSVPALEF